MKLYHEALAIYRGLADMAGTANCLNNLGLVSRAMGNLEEAKVFLGESLTLRKELKNPWAIAATLVNLALLLTTQKDFEKAGQYLQESLSIFQEINNLRGMAYSLGSLGRVAETQGRYQAAHRFHQQTLSILEKLGDRTDMAQALNGMGCALFHLEGIQAALECFRKALLIARDLKIQYLAIETLADMADILALAGKKEQALELAESILMTEVHATVKDQAEQLAASLRAGHLANEQSPSPRKAPVKSIEEHIQGYLAA
jgi:tetratricopeptide (TPR) repeat protein